MTESDYQIRKKSIEHQLSQNKKIPLQLIWAGFVTIVGSFLLPFMKAGNRWSRATFASEIGYWNAVFLFGGILLLIMPYLIFREYTKMKKEKDDLERELRMLEYERKD